MENIGVEYLTIPELMEYSHISKMSDCPELDGMKRAQYAGEGSELPIPYGYETSLPSNII